MMYRKPSKQELALIGFLIKKSVKEFSVDWQHDLLVEPMKDGGMGSLRLFRKGSSHENQNFGEQISEYQFADEDGVDVIASLNVDQFGNLYELDVWKTDYSPLKRLPDHYGDIG